MHYGRLAGRFHVPLVQIPLLPNEIKGLKVLAELGETAQFKGFEQVAERFRQDQVAQQAMSAYQEKQKEWRALVMLNALSSEQSIELETLKNAFLNQPAVQEYLKAQTELVDLCQALGDVLSEAMGSNYAAACGVSCCG